MNYLIHILIMCEIYLILALAMNLLAGYTGLLSLAQTAFYGLGAYITALLLTKAGVSFPVSLAGAVLFNLIACIPVIWFSSRLRDLFFALATIAWQIVVFTILHNWVSVTQGPFGITGIPKPELFGYRLGSLAEFALLGSGITGIILLFFIGFHQTPLSRLLQGVRDDQLAMMTFGKKPEYYKALAVLISSSISAVAGTLFATYSGYIDPSSFTLNESIIIVSMVLIGGLGTVKGSVAGAMFYVLLPEFLRFVQIPDEIGANIRMMIYSLILILLVMFRPHGLFGKYKF